MAIVFDIEKYATEDGPGIRTVVFLKGCNLHCHWCQNPESQKRAPQVMFIPSRCVACGRCVEACPVSAISVNEKKEFLTDHDACTLCGACIDACFTGARKIVGQSMTIGEIMKEIEKDLPFYRESGGGVTFSGGEPLLHYKEVAELARRARALGIHTALETAGHVSWDIFAHVLPEIDLLFFDLKHIDSALHESFTGVGLEKICANIARASEIAGDMVVRIPVIPGVNADSETMTRMFAFLADKTRVRNVQLLPFHRLGQNKYEGLGMTYAMDSVESLDRDACEPFGVIGQTMGLNVRVGGGNE